ncbi:pyrroline-5-carboxylate reductase [Bacillus sp. FJAT-42376]|uniref:pyrroline-5-carboxylate reductase n=1 Tax=Bacillus sp. FJAT-42376 TaxID=2014076 RepID=UPI000F4FFEAF|nr:pyrroline-5-carboxylate reductase [Bacillus sp. FJAT-42376]AZB43168.1 pyrroline-5-carboxylate reductase [Bacillus sp. FJAT-42376]
MRKPVMLFIGAGRMAEAMIAGLTSKKEQEIERIIVSNQSNSIRLERLKQQYGADTVFHWQDHIKDADTIVLAVPPEEHEEIFTKLRGLVTTQLIVTIAAGIGPSKMEQALPDSAVSWIMPNTASQIGQSMSLFCKGSKPLDDLQERSLTLLLDAIGHAEECSEEEIHHLTAITGSAPAFVYLFAEVLIEKAKEYGIAESKAQKLVSLMISGSAAMLNENGDPAFLREQVTTPGGSTAEGIKVLEKNEFASVLKEAVTAVNKKALS